MKRVLVLMLTLQFIMFSTPAIASAGQKKGVEELKPEKKYRVEFMNGSRFTIQGKDLILTDEYLGIRKGSSGDFRYYHQSQLKRIIKGSHWLEGMGIGAAAGLGTSILILSLTKTDCSDADDVGDCQALASLGKIAFGALGVALGSAVGAGVGAAIPNKVRLTVSPTVMSAPGRPLAGGGIGIAGRF